MADQAAAATADKGQSNGNKFCVCEAEATFFLWVWRVKKDNERFWRLGSYKFRISSSQIDTWKDC